MKASYFSLSRKIQLEFSIEDLSLRDRLWLMDHLMRSTKVMENMTHEGLKAFDDAVAAAQATAR